MIPPILVFGVGNESRGDDALGVLLLRQLETWVNAKGYSEQFELLEDFQLQIEHALDMKDRQLVLFLDAGINAQAPFSFHRAQQITEPVLYSHALVPEALLKVYTQFYDIAPPDVFILCVCGEYFELGEGLSARSEHHLVSAFEFGKMLLEKPDSVVWENLCLG